MDLLPVVFIHSGYREYFKYVLKQAVKMKNKVYLLGDRTNQHIENIGWYNIEEFSLKYYCEFKEKYKHMSTNSYQFELMCFKRYFILYEFLKRENIDSCILCDSDLMIYVDFNEVNINFTDLELIYSGSGTQERYRWSYSAHCSYWTINNLKKFLAFIQDVYENHLEILEEKWRYHQKNAIRGGICDMTLLYLYVEKNVKKTFLNSTSIKPVFDHSIRSTEGYFETQFVFDKKIGCKKIVFIDAVPYFFEKNTGEKIRTYTIHAQGRSKMYISCFFYNRNSLFYYYWEAFKYLIRNYCELKRSILNRMIKKDV